MNDKLNTLKENLGDDLKAKIDGLPGLEEKVKDLLDLDNKTVEKSAPTFEDYFNLIFTLSVGVIEVSKLDPNDIVPQLEKEMNNNLDISREVLEEYGIETDVAEVFSLLVAIYQHKTQKPVNSIREEFEPLLIVLHTVESTGMLPYALSSIKSFDGVNFKNFETQFNGLLKLVKTFKLKDFIRTWLGKDGEILIDLFGNSFDYLQNVNAEVSFLSI